jgi:hypothetical protein
MDDHSSLSQLQLNHILKKIPNKDLTRLNPYFYSFQEQEPPDK